LQQALASCPPIYVLKPPPARAKRIVFEDEVGPAGRPPGGATVTVAFTEEGENLTPPRPCRKYPAIRSGQQREEYRAVFTDQHAEYKELLGEVRAARRRLGQLEAAVPALSHRQDSAFLEKQRRCEYLRKKLTHIKMQIQEYDRSTRSNAVYF
ncbi:MALD2 protein, partial [Chauna torquata]|nr:MALD2 protein [Chauna torquata]